MPKSGFTQFTQSRITKRMFGNVAYTEPTKIYVEASTTTINVDGTGATPPSDPSYVRVELDNNTATWEDLTIGVGRQNAVPIEYATATTNWGVITYVAFYDAPTGGNMLYYAELITPKTIGVDDVLRADVGAVQIRINPTA